MSAVTLAVSHFAVLPVAVPLLAGATLLCLRATILTRAISAVSLLSLLGMAGALVASTAGGAAWVYTLGNWPVPFGIAMAVDRLAATMLFITAVMGIACQLAASDRAGSLFSALLQFQLAGLNGAFLTADLFNLFVFFEVLLAASYALLLDGEGGGRLRAGLHYVTVNLLGSSLFLIAAAMFYGIAGTLNLVDLDARLASLPVGDTGLAQVAGMLLLVVFAIKAAALPLGLWLPGTYGAAPAHVAALFAIMTKVGIYSILRVHGSLFESAPSGSVLAGMALPWLLAAGLLTLLLGAAGALTARDLRALVAWLVVGSAGTLLAAIGLGTVAATTAALFYLPHSTFALGAAFLAVECIARGRARSAAPAENHYLIAGGLSLRGMPWIAACFFMTGLVAAGLPPGSGFIAKSLLLDAAADTTAGAVFWSVVLVAGLVTVVAIARTASSVFWKPADAPLRPVNELGGRVIGNGLIAACIVLLGGGGLLALFARPVYEFLLQAAPALVGS